MSLCSRLSDKGPTLFAGDSSRILRCDSLILGTVRRLTVAWIAGDHAVFVQEV